MKLLSKDVSYLVGFVQCDGSMSRGTRNRGRLSIELSSRDEDIIHKLRSIIVTAYPKQILVTVFRRTRDTNFKHNYSSVGLRVCDGGFRKWMNKYVPYGKKDTLIKPPYNVRKSDYIRGLSDANGSIGTTANGRCFWSICVGSDSIKEYILKSVKLATKINHTVNRNKRDGVYNIILFDEDAQKYTKFLYASAGTTMNRKYNDYARVRDWVRTAPRRRAA